MREPDSNVQRPRITLDVKPEFRRRLRLAAAKRDTTVRAYVLEALEERLRQDIDDEGERLLALTARSDSLLAELWDNERDAAYDRL